ncbi:hypothetical protein NDU88_001249 [Pleurodeles waltl]|uniref:Zinc finger CCHC domain-containing protein n=1 Tax=Pleurodeles waltl TaxID=8319 RepID=A0AAV7SZD6_PLEWA|nr:hypothetical protein NDU88_001249 [Pleurodeles waltl]
MSDAPKGTYLLTFMSESICRRYWQMCWSRRDEKPFADFHLEYQLVLEVKRMTVHVYNPHVNIQDLTTFLRRHCTVTREPSRNLDTDGIWDGKWTVMVKLKEDPAAPHGIHHPPSSFSLGRDSGYLYYPGSPDCATSVVNRATPLKITQCKCARTAKEKDTQPGHAKRKPPATSAVPWATVSKTARKEPSPTPRRPNLLGERHRRRLPWPAFQSQHPERPRKLGGGKAPGRSKSNLTKAPPQSWSHGAQKKECLPSLRVCQQTTLPNSPLRTRKKNPGQNRSAGKGGTVPHK